VTSQAKRPEIVEVAFAAALAHGQDVIGIPEALTAARFQPPLLQRDEPSAARKLANAVPFRIGIDPACGTEAAIPFEDLFA
jgi:hypothetical protein